MNPAVAARARQLQAEADHRRALREFRASHAVDRQARINALLQEAVAALASLLSTPAPAARPACRQPPRTRGARPPEP